MIIQAKCMIKADNFKRNFLKYFSKISFHPIHTIL